MRVPKGVMMMFSLLLLVLAFLLSLSSGYTFSTTGYVSMPTNVVTFSLSAVAIVVILAFVFTDEKDEEDDYVSSMYYPSGDKNFDKIEKLCRYSEGKKANPTKIVKEMRTYIKAMIDNPYYLKTLPTEVQKELNTIYYGHSDRKSATLHLKHLRNKLTDMNASYT